MTQTGESWTVGGVELRSRLFLGTARYPSADAIAASVRASGAEVVTVSLRREGGEGQAFWKLIEGLGVRVLPNTAGCRTVAEVITTAEMAREVFETPWLKLEITGDDQTLQPDPFGLVEAATALTKRGFVVFPYTTEDLVLGERLLDAGCACLMPWGAPIGSGRGLNNRYGLRAMRERFPSTPLIIDAGIGAPSHACEAMELGYDAILLNTAVARAHDPERMARAFAGAIDAGRLGHGAGIIPAIDVAERSTPLADTPFWHTPR